MPTSRGDHHEAPASTARRRRAPLWLVVLGSASFLVAKIAARSRRRPREALARVDLASRDTFPASDPPSWNMGEPRRAAARARRASRPVGDR
jgi:hypothetical protein